jgi:hypothetical protein
LSPNLKTTYEYPVFSDKAKAYSQNGPNLLGYNCTKTDSTIYETRCGECCSRFGDKSV